MVDRLKQSVEFLEAPSCTNCHVEMKWYRSHLTAESEPQIVVHHFHCPNCHLIVEKTTLLIKGQDGIPPKLSAPRRFSCAA